MSKYDPLWEHIKKLNKEEIKLNFEDIKKVLSFDIDHSFLNFKKELEKFGFEVGKISLKDKTVIFKKLSKWYFTYIIKERLCLSFWINI